LKTFLGRVELLNATFVATILDEVLQVGPWEQSWRSKQLELDVLVELNCIGKWDMWLFFYHLAMSRGWVWMTLHMHVFTMVSNNGVHLLQVISLF
jgi:hypothetical protein